MQNDNICVCPLCLRAIRDRIRLTMTFEPRPLGVFTVRALGGLGWVPWVVYAHLFHQLADRGELVKFVPDDPRNQPTRYLLSTSLPTPRALAEREGATAHEHEQRTR